MGLAEDRVLIGDNTFCVTILPSSVARKTLVRLTKVFGPVLSGLFSELEIKPGTSVEDVRKKVGGKLLAKVVEVLSSNIREEDLEYLVDTFGKATFLETSDGKRFQLTKERIELLFTGGKLMDMFRWLAFCIRFNYSDFFAAWVSVGPVQSEVEKGLSQ